MVVVVVVVAVVVATRAETAATAAMAATVGPGAVVVAVEGVGVVAEGASAVVSEAAATSFVNFLVISIQLEVFNEMHTAPRHNPGTWRSEWSRTFSSLPRRYAWRRRCPP